MPLTEKGQEIMHGMQKTYKSPEKAKEVFYASKNAGTISGVDAPYGGKPGAEVLYQPRRGRDADLPATSAAGSPEGRVPQMSTSESPTGNMGASEGLVGVEDAALRDRMFPNRHHKDEVSGVGAESWVGNKKTGYSINAADAPEHPSFKGDRSLLGNKDATPIWSNPMGGKK